MNLIHIRFRNKDGSALIMVIIALLFATILVTSAAILTQTNTLQASTQEKGMQSYYIARSGAELAFEVLLTSGPPSLLTPFVTNIGYTLPNATFPNATMNIANEGTATVSVTAFDTGSPAVRRIRITSVGEAVGTNIQRTAILEFNLATQDDLIWTR